MRVVIEIRCGSGTGRKALLAAGQVLKVGRTQWADFTVDEDGHMSGVHFSLQTDRGVCFIEDLGSSNGTRLNGQPLGARTALRSGDKIDAGRTGFVVHIEADDTELDVADETLARPDVPPPTMPAVSLPLPDGQPVLYTVESCDSGLTLCRGETDPLSAASVAVLLAQAYQPYFIVDFRNLTGVIPEEIESPDFLFDWLDPAAAVLASPIVLSGEEYAAWPELIEQGWGEDAIICLFSKQEKPAVLEHLRHCIRPKEQADGTRKGAILGFCWPSVMAPLLSNYKPKPVEDLLAGIEAVLVELPDLPITWQVYGHESIVSVLDGLGFTREEPEEEPPPEEEES